VKVDQEINVNLHVHLHEDRQLIQLVEQIITGQQKIKEIVMATNQELVAFAARVDAATDNIAADIKRILENASTVLSDEDRALLESSVAKLEALASETPE